METELLKTKTFLIENWYNPYYLSIYGSQNYWLAVDTEDYKSDIDFKCIIIPTVDELIRNSKPLSTVIEYDWWQIDLKDIRSYTESVVKCNVNFLEILQSDFYIGGDFFREYLKPLMEEMGQFYLKACYWMMLEKYEALRHPYPSTIAKIERFWYDPKQLHHIVRLYLLMKRYIDGDFPNFIHSGTERDYLLQIKVWEIPNDKVDEIANEFISKAKELRESYKIEPCFDTKNLLIEKSYSIIKNNLWYKQ